MADGFHALREHLARGELIAFVGAGASKPGGLPLWPELVQSIRADAVRAGIHAIELADIDRSISGGQLIDALTELERHLGATSFARVIAKQLDDRSGPSGQPRPVPDVVQALAELAPGLRAVVTTNLDAFIQRAFPREWQSFDRLTGDLGSRHRYIFRLHGAVHDRSTWVLTRTEYDRVMDRDPLYHTYFSAVFLTQPMLFVGFGLTEPHFDRIAQKIRALARGQPPHHFALVPDDQITPAQRRKMGESGIELLGYPSYDALPAVLRSLKTPALAPGNLAGRGGVMYSAPSSAPTTPFGASPLVNRPPHPASSSPLETRPHPSDTRAQPTPRSTLKTLGLVLGVLAFLTIAVLAATFAADSSPGDDSDQPKEVADKGVGLDSAHALVGAASNPQDDDPPSGTAEDDDQVDARPQEPASPTSMAEATTAERPTSGGSGWYQAVLDSLNEVKVPLFSHEDPMGTFKFQLTVCKDGSIKRMTKKGGSMNIEQQKAVSLALAQHRLPKPPPSIAATMKIPCAKIRYTFTWVGSGVK